MSLVFFLPHHNSGGFAVLNVWHLLRIYCVNWYHLQKCVFWINAAPIPWSFTKGELTVCTNEAWCSVLLKFLPMAVTLQIPQGGCPMDVFKLTIWSQILRGRKWRHCSPLPLSPSSPVSSPLLFIELARLYVFLQLIETFPCSWNGNLALCSYCHCLLYLSLPAGLPPLLSWPTSICWYVFLSGIQIWSPHFPIGKFSMAPYCCI